MTARRRPTMKDVAEHAGVSVSTVSYVLNESDAVAPERRNRVLDAIRPLEYSPNESARSAASARDVLVVPHATELPEENQATPPRGQRADGVIYREALAGAGIDPDSVPVYVGVYRQASTSVRQPARDMGYRAATALFDMSENQQSDECPPRDA